MHCGTMIASSSSGTEFNLSELPRADIIALSGGNDYVNMMFTEPALLEGIRSFGRVIEDVIDQTSQSCTLCCQKRV